MADMTDDSTVIGQSITIRGSLHGEEDLTVLGRVEGELHLTQTLMVADSGIVKAEISVRDAVISGIVVGNVTAADCIQITETGRILGDVRAKRVMLSAGGKIRGNINVGEAGHALLIDDTQALADDTDLSEEDSVAQPTSLMARRTAAGGMDSALAARPAIGSGGFKANSQAAMALAMRKKKVVVKKH